MSSISNTANFIKKAQIKHRNKYDYSQTSYGINNKDKVIIICKKHGGFKQTPNSHLKGRGCPICWKEQRGQKRKKLLNKFIMEAINIHGNKYDYSQVVYQFSLTPIKIICSIHGEFYQRPANHLEGQGCPKCGIVKNSKLRLLTIDEFIKKSNELHGNFYDYSESIYTHSKFNIKIICPRHGVFEQLPNVHLMGGGCPVCANKKSHGEQEILEFIQSIYHGEILSRSHKLIPPKELDIYLPEYGLAIEYCGLYWHSDKFINPKSHQNKFFICKERGIRLLTIFEFDWKHNKELVKSTLQFALHKCLIKMNARKLQLKELNKLETKRFFEENHFQGFLSIYPANCKTYALVDLKNIPQIAICFGKPRYRKDIQWEIIRLASKKNVSVRGGVSKLFKEFLKQNNPESIITYSDLRWGEGKIYLELGFVFEKYIRPNYFYFRNNGESPLYSRVHFQKHKLIKKLKIFDAAKSESANMQANGWLRIFDCGNAVYLWTKFPRYSKPHQQEKHS